MCVGLLFRRVIRRDHRANIARDKLRNVILCRCPRRIVVVAVVFCRVAQQRARSRTPRPRLSAKKQTSRMIVACFTLHRDACFCLFRLCVVHMFGRSRWLLFSNLRDYNESKSCLGLVIYLTFFICYLEKMILFKY